ncbi:MAG: tetratricopeptide repeat protein [Candidatus Sericytochromatia bacterium]
MKHLPLLVAILAIGTLLPPSPVSAAEFGQLPSKVQGQLERLSDPRTADNVTTHFLEMYLWSKDSFEIAQWPELWEQMEHWPSKWESLLTGQQQTKAMQLQAAYALLLHKYEPAQAALPQTPKGFYLELIQALLGEQSPEQPGVWRIALAPSRKLAQQYPRQVLAHLVLAEACLERVEQVGNQQALLREAQTAIQQALRLEPHQLYARYQQGQVLYLQGQTQQALQHFENKVARQDPVAAEAVGNFYVWMQQPETAWHFFEMARLEVPERVRLYQKMEQLAALRGKPMDAFQLYLDGLARQPQSQALYLRLESFYPQLSEHDMRQALQKILPLRGYVTALIEGDLARRSQQAAQARRWYEQALNQDPERPEAYRNLLEMFWEARQLDEMNKVLIIAREENVKSLELNYWRGVVALHRHQLAEARRWLEPLLKTDSRAHYTLAMVYRQEGKYAEARELLSQLVQQDPQNATLLLALGDTYFEAKQYPEAESTYLWARRVAPYHPDVAFSLGNLYAETARYPEAMAFLERALLMDPDSVDIRNNLGNLYIRQQRLEAAIGMFQGILNKQPDYAAAYYNLACAYALSNAPDQAFHHLQRALELDTSLKKTARSDRDLQNLRQDQRFEDLLRE